MWRPLILLRRNETIANKSSTDQGKRNIPWSFSKVASQNAILIFIKYCRGSFLLYWKHIQRRLCVFFRHCDSEVRGLSLKSTQCIHETLRTIFYFSRFSLYLFVVFSFWRTCDWCIDTRVPLFYKPHVRPNSQPSTPLFNKHSDSLPSTFCLRKWQHRKRWSGLRTERPDDLNSDLLLCKVTSTMIHNP